MTRRPAALLAIALATGLALTACAAPEEPVASPTSSPSATPTPTPEVLIVAGGEKPPPVFGGDCAAALTAEQISRVLGGSFQLVEAEFLPAIANVGGISCKWTGATGSVQVQILPRTMLAGTSFSADEAEYYFEECSPTWVCGWQNDDAMLWAGGGFQTAGMSRATVDSWGAELSALIAAANEKMIGEAWIRDVSDWWPLLDCSEVASRLGTELGARFSGESIGYVDPPIPGLILADQASRDSACSVAVQGTSERPIELHSTPGAAWDFATTEGPEIATGVTVITARIDEGYQSIDSIAYTLTDGTNLLWATVPTTADWSDEEALTAIAQAAASGWK